MDNNEEKAIRGTPEQQAEFEKSLKTSPLATSLNDHRSVGSGFSGTDFLIEAMAAEPDKPILDFLSENQVATYIERELSGLARAKDSQNPVIMRVYEDEKQRLRITLDYLRQRSRLPEKFKDLTLE